MMMPSMSTSCPPEVKDEQLREFIAATNPSKSLDFDVLF